MKKSKRKSKRTILVALADTHGGNKLGLLNPDTMLYEESPEGDLSEYRPNLTASQGYLWELYLKCIEDVRDIAGKDRVCVLHVGDLTQGNKYPQALVSTRIADQIIIANDNIKPWCEIPNVTHVRLAGGTASHEFLESTSPILVTKQLSDEHPEKDIEMCQHGLLDVDGVNVDYSHHGPFPGSRVWLRGNVARYYLRDLMMQEIMHGNRPPDLVLRAHYHTPVEEYLKIMGYKAWLYILPSFCMLNLYARQATRSVPAIVNGLNAYEIMDGQITDVYELHQRLDVRTKESI